MTNHPHGNCCLGQQIHTGLLQCVCISFFVSLVGPSMLFLTLRPLMVRKAAKDLSNVVAWAGGASGVPPHGADQCRHNAADDVVALPAVPAPHQPSHQTAVQCR